VKWYFIVKLLLVIVCLCLWRKVSDAVDLGFGITFVADFTIVPIIYFIFSAFRKKKLRPGEYRVRPEGKAL
jgi:hypothetical protein